MTEYAVSHRLRRVAPQEGRGRPIPHHDPHAMGGLDAEHLLTACWYNQTDSAGLTSVWMSEIQDAHQRETAERLMARLTELIVVGRASPTFRQISTFGTNFYLRYKFLPS